MFRRTSLSIKTLDLKEQESGHSCWLPCRKHYQGRSWSFQCGWKNHEEGCLLLHFPGFINHIIEFFRDKNWSKAITCYHNNILKIIFIVVYGNSLNAWLYLSMAIVMKGFSTSMGLVRLVGRQRQRSTAREVRSILLWHMHICMDHIIMKVKVEQDEKVKVGR